MCGTMPSSRSLLPPPPFCHLRGIPPLHLCSKIPNPFNSSAALGASPPIGATSVGTLMWRASEQEDIDFDVKLNKVHGERSGNGGRTRTRTRTNRWESKKIRTLSTNSCETPSGFSRYFLLHVELQSNKQHATIVSAGLKFLPIMTIRIMVVLAFPLFTGDSRLPAEFLCHFIKIFRHLWIQHRQVYSPPIPISSAFTNPELLLRLLIAIFPFLGSWTKIL